MDKTNFSFLYVSYFPKYGYVCINTTQNFSTDTKVLRDLDLSEFETWAVIPVNHTLQYDFLNRLHGYLGKYLISGFGWFYGCTKDEIKKAVETTVWFFNTVQKVSTNLDLTKMNKPEEELWYFPWMEPISNWPFGVIPKYPELYNTYNLEVYTRKTGSERGRPKSTHIDQL